MALRFLGPFPTAHGRDTSDRAIGEEMSLPNSVRKGTSPYGSVALMILDEGEGARRARDLVAGLPGGRVLDAVALLRARAPAFSREFADFIAELSRLNKGPDWWTLSLPGKNPLTVPLAARALALSVIAEQASSLPAGGELWVCSNDDALAAAAARWARARGTAFTAPAPRPGLKRRFNRLTPLGPLAGLVRAAWSLWRSRRFGTPALPPGARPAVFFTFFGPASFDAEGRYRDMFFGELIDEAVRRGLSPIVWGAAARGAAADYPLRGATDGPAIFLPLDAFLNWEALWLIFRRAVSLRASGFELRGERTLGGVDLTDLLQDELDENLNSSRFFSDLWYGACAEALLRHVSPKSLNYPFENLARERSFLPVFREFAPHARLIGYQHASLTFNHLNFLLGRGEAELLPLPDRVVTTGTATRDFLRDWGRFPESLLQAGCALRQPPAQASGDRRPDPDRFRLLVAAATSAEELAGILRLLDEAYGVGAPGWLEIVLRPHPLFPLSAGLARSGPVRFAYTDGSTGSLSERIQEADAVAYVSSTAGIEAVANGVPAVCLDQGHGFGIDPMAGVSDFKWTAGSGAELRAAVESVRALPAEEYRRRRERAKDWAATYLTAPSPAALEAFFR